MPNDSTGKVYKKNSHCSYCGTPFAEEQPWPRRCAFCGNTTYRNPLPVAVLLLPVDEGLLVVRRTINPGKGMLGLPGGFINLGESWQAAAARELFEETGITVDPGEVREFRVHSAPDGTLLVFGLALPRSETDLPPFVPSDEASERVILTAPAPLAFSTHTQVVQEYFEQKDH
ncbi:MAG TPA: NUDIX domain-containing protein [Chloroflexia bacterium]|nr:NUDIX domain-containing protein [Chloroflexia bacterium]